MGHGLETVRRLLAAGVLAVATTAAVVSGPGRPVARAWRERDPGVPREIYGVVHPATRVAAALAREGVSRDGRGCIWRPTPPPGERRWDREYLIAPFRYHCYPRSVELVQEGDDLRKWEFFVVQEAYEIFLCRSLGKRPYRMLHRASGWTVYLAEPEGAEP